MKSKSHFYISLAKSLIRLSGAAYCVFFPSMEGLVVLGGMLFTAEILGILEEVWDKR